jgi:transcriptional regulator with XRE-family HTH domain
MLPYLIAGAIGFGIGKLFEEGGETFGRGGMTNEDILRSFLTSNRETQTNNLSTHYNQYDDFLLLRNYSTLIAIRKGNDVRITNIKYSNTTSAITNRLKALAEEMGYNVSYVSKFEEGGETFRRGGRTPKKVIKVRARGGYSLEDFFPLFEVYNEVVSYKKVGKLELQQIIGKKDVSDEFEFKTEADRDYWFEILNKEQEKYFTVQNKKKYVKYVLNNFGNYSEEAEDNDLKTLSEKLDYFADDLDYDLRLNTTREDFIYYLDLDVKDKYTGGGGVGEFEIYDEETGKTLIILAHSQEEAEGISATIDFNDYENGDLIDVLDDIANYNAENEEYAEGGEAKKRRRRANVQTGRTDRSVDKTRVGKPVGYRFSNSLASKLRKDKYAVPTEKQITKYLGKGIYKENRKNRSDRDKTVKL